MIRFPRSHSPDRKDEEQELLQSLLLAPVPARDDMLRPVVLRSADEQRRVVHRFLPRRADMLLYRFEQLLILAVVAFFTFWFLDGYGRDWLYEQGWLPRQQSVLASQSPVAASSRLWLRNRWEATNTSMHSAMHAPSLPFTNPGVERSPVLPDYLAPQSIVVPPEPGDPRPYRLLMPSIGVDTPVQEVFVENNTWQVADYAAGYHYGSALPGNVGNTVFAGHAGLRGAVFRDLGHLQVGDDIFVDAGGWRYHYRARQFDRVWPTQIEVMDSTATPVITLITCTDWDTKRLVVIADLVGSRPL